jgi:hypothetical protein
MFEREYANRFAVLVRSESLEMSSHRLHNRCASSLALLRRYIVFTRSCISVVAMYTDQCIKVSWHYPESNMSDSVLAKLCQHSVPSGKIPPPKEISKRAILQLTRQWLPTYLMIPQATSREISNHTCLIPTDNVHLAPETLTKERI